MKIKQSGVSYLSGTKYDKIEKIWSGPKSKEIYSRDMTVGEAIVLQLRKTPQRVIQILESTGESLTAQEFLDHSMALAKNMLEMGIVAGDIVGGYAKMSLHLGTVMLASFLCGTPVHGVFQSFEKDIIANIYATTRPKIIFCDAENYKNALYVVQMLQLDAKIILMTGSIGSVLNIKDLIKKREDVDDLSIFPCTKMTSSDTAAILSSSGTTGTPKGILCSHHAMLHNVPYLNATMDSVLMCFSSMFWATGVTHFVQGLLYSALRIVPDRPYRPEYFLDVIKRYKVTHCFATSAQIADWVMNINEDVICTALRSIDTLMTGGSAVPQPIQDKIIDILSDNTKRPGFVMIYGSSEIFLGCSINGGYPYESKAKTVGKLWLNREVCIVDENGKRLGPNETGEIYVHTPNIWMGYYENPKATAQAKDGKWIRTGDLGCFDEDGFLHLMGRSKEMIKWISFQISPQAIEELLEPLPGVAEVCVFGVPDLAAGSLVACGIVRTPDKEGDLLTEEMVNEYLESKMDGLYLLHGGVYFIDALPRTDTGKVQRLKMLQLIEEEIDR
ncbi:uncharacterized protein LOC131801702 [Musca domestica]|uniref:Uncharacterized protein LOC131801702 n=1 Tax=Musca domestica TaxID=7370 RepID=A0ABM3USW4_MUSDO|nr:uncharacterized protein LOC131801702 [Musca domestica]